VPRVWDIAVDCTDPVKIVIINKVFIGAAESQSAIFSEITLVIKEFSVIF